MKMFGLMGSPGGKPGDEEGERGLRLGYLKLGFLAKKGEVGRF